MKYKYVKKCDCCATKLSQIATPPISVNRKQELADLMIEVLVDYQMRGKFSLVCTDDLIVAFQFEYANKAELKKSEQLCEGLHNIACRFYEAQTHGAEIQLYDFEIA